jgi:hypothetical protein
LDGGIQLSTFKPTSSDGGGVSLDGGIQPSASQPISSNGGGGGAPPPEPIG